MTISPGGKGTMVLTNPELTPTFLPETTVVLKKTYTTQDDPYFSRHLTKGVPGETIHCGLSIYAYDPETGEDTGLVDGEEWCLIELVVDDYDEALCFVKAKDLTDLTTLSFEEVQSSPA